MSEIVQFPATVPTQHVHTDSPITEDDLDQRHAEAFRDMEGRIDDCRLMAIIALEMAERAIAGREDKHEKAMFAVFEVAKMLKKLKADYQAMWHGERVAP